MAIRFLGELAEVDVGLWVARDSRLLRLRERLSRVEVNGQPIGRAKAQTLVERLLVGALDDFGNRYMRVMGEHVDAIVRIRGELSTRYQQVIGHFEGGGYASRLPRRTVNVAELTRLFDELDQHVAAVNDRTGARALEPGFFEARNPEARYANPDDALAHATGEDWATELGRGDQPVGVGPEAEVRPDLPLDPIHEGYQPWEMTWGEPERLATYRGREAVEGAVERGVELLPSREVTKEQARVVLRRWAADAIPPDWASNVRLVADYTEPLAAQFAEAGLTDANFARNRVEVWIKPPGGREFRPDGVRFLDAEGRRYLFLEHKEPPSTEDIARFTSPEGRAKLLTEMENDAVVARELQTRGCQGWAYSTSSPEVAEMMTSIIAELRVRSPELGRLLHAPVVR